MLGTCEKIEAANRTADGRGEVESGSEFISLGKILNRRTFSTLVCDDVTTHFAAIA